MVQVRNVHVDKGHGEQSNWLAAIAADDNKAALVALDNTLAALLPADDAQAHIEYRLKGREMVEILSDLNLDLNGLRVALLVPYFEAGLVDDEWLEQHCSQDVAQLVATVQQMQSISELQHFRRGKPSDTQIDTVRRMLLAMVEDVRAVLVKLAERICFLRLVKHAEEEERVLAAKECSEIYAPLANRLGIGQLKWELEDLAFRYLHPDIYKQIAQQLDEKRLQRESYIETFVQTLNEELAKNDIQAEVYGRPKHIFSIWKKMQKKSLRFDELYDIRAVRVVTESLKDCYGALGIVHSLWRHLAAEFDDYVATPKANGYQSIHTVVIGPSQKNIEIQIRSRQMHDDAELGVAAHWMYKEGQVTTKAQGYEDKIAWLRKLLAWHEDMAENEDLVQEIRSQVFEDRVYVFTPKGDVVDLPMGSTPLDFAYYIHSQIGHRCIGAKVDGRIVPFTYRLQNAERVEVMTQKEPNPKRDWLNPQLGYLRSSRARSKVHTYFKKHDREHYLQLGREQLEAELQRHQLSMADVPPAVKKFNMQHMDDLLVGIGAGDVRLQQVVNSLRSDHDDEQEQLERLASRRKGQKAPEQNRDGVKIAGIGNLMMSFAQCCQPLPGDPIVGYITKGRGVSVHHQECDNVQNLLEQAPGRGIDVEWQGNKQQTFAVDLSIVSLDRAGLLYDITSILTNEKLSVRNVNTRQDKDGHVFVSLTVLVQHQHDVQRLLSKLQQVPHVLNVQRKT
ncbi:GTP diphosphokinase [Aliidiomarina taiwanensis]|uniref:GTP pyrophosphokinase n=1 Tax=Aliidiomarina taiwanensis TaxID=946228 RepID=A0A432XA39_9GAMM|nr:GTP diphosphokinase [Aliidiomarina taiwanensis]RUO44229.1 GTP diphosphokinase [Aliidiomarina taiwanensis]